MSPNRTRPDQFVEDYPHVRVSHLKRLGIFSPSPQAPVRYIFGDLTVRISRRGDILRFEFPKKVGLRNQYVHLAYDKLKHGDRPWFVCPLLGGNYNCLYLKLGVLASRKAHKLTYASQAGPFNKASAQIQKRIARIDGTDGKGPARGDRRRQLAHEAYKLGSDMGLGPASEVMRRLQGIIDEPPPQKRGPAGRRKRPAGPIVFGPSKAYFSPSIIAGGMLDYVHEQLRGRHELPKLAALNVPIGILEDYPTFDLGLVLPKGWKLGDELALQLRAPGLHVRRPIEIWVYAGSDPNLGQFLVINQEDGDIFQAIGLEASSHDRQARIYMVCPVTGKRVSRLYLRDRRFASAAAQRLIHRSQRSKDPLREEFRRRDDYERIFDKDMGGG